MKNFLADLGARLSSRKFLLTVSAGTALVANKQYAELVGVVSAYVLGEAGVDVARTVKSTRTAADAAEQHDEQVLQAVHAEV